MAKNHSDRRDALFESAEYLAEVLARCIYIEENFFRSQSSDKKMIRPAIIRVYKAILQYTAEARNGQNFTPRKGILDNIRATTIQRLTQHQFSIEKEEEKLHRLVEFDNMGKTKKATEDILTAIDDRLSKSLNALILNFRLPIAEGALLGFYENQRDAVPMCLKDTRLDVLSQISEWTDSPESKCFFWLNGMAGTGKSTIARTVANSFQEKGQLGATFFFKKGQADRDNGKRFISTIAKQLMNQNHQLASVILEAISKDSDIAAKALREQFTKLLLQPLQNLAQDRTRAMVIVIDALDECAQDDMHIILQLLPEVQKIKTIRVKIFLTSRPERPILQVFKRNTSNWDLQDYEELVLHEVENSTIEHDIRLFFEKRLSEIREKDTELSTEWPAGETIDQLVMESVPLFIYAATVCRFIGNGKQRPQKRLDTVLQSQTGPPRHQMENIYQAILEQLLDPEDQTESRRIEKEFRDIVGVVILLATPLSVHALGKLLPLPISTRDIKYLLDKLHSVLSVPADDHFPVDTLHKSFREYLLNTESGFRVSEQETHANIASYCLHVMGQNLKRDICNLRNHGKQRADIDSQAIEQSLQKELQYSCRYWVYHLEGSGARISEREVLPFLKEHFLHWLEAMSLIGLISEAVGMINCLQGLEVSTRRTNLQLVTNLKLGNHGIRFFSISLRCKKIHP